MLEFYMFGFYVIVGCLYYVWGVYLNESVSNLISICGLMRS